MIGIASLYTTCSLSESIGSEDEKNLEMVDEKSSAIILGLHLKN